MSAGVSTSYLVNEIYPCLQGEGRNVGLPSVLVRLQICNLRCTWCDTPYTHTLKSDPVDPADPVKGQSFERLTVEALAARIRAHAPVRHVILSGGEPTLQNLVPVMDALGAGYSAEVETNGTRIPHHAHAGFREEDYARFQWNVSPKGSNADEAWVPEALAHWVSLAARQQDVYFKFVVRRREAKADLAEIETFLSRFEAPRDRVYLMAEGTSVDSQVGQAWLHDICLARGFRYAPRLHVLLFGPRRGV